MRSNPTSTGKGGMGMTILDFIAVASFGLTSFGLGFALGLAIKK